MRLLSSDKRQVACAASRTCDGLLPCMLSLRHLENLLSLRHLENLPMLANQFTHHMRVGCIGVIAVKLLLCPTTLLPVTAVLLPICCTCFFKLHVCGNRRPCLTAFAMNRAPALQLITRSTALITNLTSCLLHCTTTCFLVQPPHHAGLTCCHHHQRRCSHQALSPLGHHSLD
jgi:hypothetical protein